MSITRLMISGVLALGLSTPAPAQMVTGLAGSQGSTVGPDGALYVTEAALGQISRIDPVSGDVSVYAEGLPPWAFPGPSGAVDVAFLDGVAHALVTLVDFGEGGPPVNGIYRMESPSEFSVLADLGAWSLANPPEPAFDIPTGVQYAMQTFRGGFLVSDGHHNRVLWVSADGGIHEAIAFDNVVPTGLEVHGNTIYVAQAGPAPHSADDGTVVTFGPKISGSVPVAGGAALAVDVEFGQGRTLYALSQGTWNGQFPGSSAIENDGALLQVNPDGTMTELIHGINLPSSLEFIGNTAYVVTLTGEVWAYKKVSDPPFGRRH